MKLTTVFLLLGLLSVNANTFGQRIFLSKKNQTLIEIFKQIKKQSDYNFVYNSQKIKLKDKFSIHLENASIEEALETIFKNSSYTYEIINKTIVIQEKEVIPSTIYQSKIDIKGKIVDKDGLPLMGAVIKSKQSQKGASSLADGSFELKAIDDNDKIIISYIGFISQELPATNDFRNVVLLNDVKSMDEVVVVGYGTQKKENLTGAISQISDKDIGLRPSPNIITSLQGLLPGLNIQSNNGNPGDRPDINIRGFNSINGGSPLVLIDGIQGDIDRVNPLDVQTVTVLKDAASSAIYGARGAFGVILVTTKKGKAGKTVVNYTNNIGQTTPVTRTDFISDPYLYGKTVDAALFGYNGTTYTGYTTDSDWEKIRKVSTGELAPFHELQSDGTYKFFYNTDWYKYLFRKWQATSNHNISISAGNDKIQGYLSGRAYKTTTIQNIVDPDLKKQNIRGNLNFIATKWLEISDNIQVSTDNQIEFGGGKNGYGGMWSNTTWYNLFPIYPTNIDGVPFDWWGSGAQGSLERGDTYIKQYSEQFINTISAKLTPLKDLVINADYSNTVNHISNSTRLNTYDYLTTNKLQLQTGGLNRLTEVRNRNYYNALNVYGTYSRSFLEDTHHVKLLLGYNREDYNSDNITAEQGGLLVNNLSSLNLGTQLLQATGTGSIWAVEGYFGRFNYDYKNRYLLEINSRYDGSSRFPEVSRWGIFPSVSAAWVISQESFFKPLEGVVNSLKLRASYGKLGNQNVDLFTFNQILSTGQTAWLNGGIKMNYAGVPAPLPSVVSWENSKTIDVGGDIGFLNNKLMASFSWYEKNVSGMYLPGSPLPAVFGAAEPKENTASLRNRGFEFSLGYNNSFSVKGAPLRVRASASLYNFEGVITKYNNPNGLMSTFWEGQKLGTIYGYHVEGQFQSDAEAKAYQDLFTNPTTTLGQVYNLEINVVQNTQFKGLRGGDLKYIDTNGDGSINKGKNTLADHGDLQEIGNAMPKFPFGFNLGADWKSFDFSIAGAGVAHQDWLPIGNIFWGPYARPYLSFIRKDLVSNAWTPESPGNTYPQIARAYAALGNQRSMSEPNDYYITDVGYMRIKNITIGYTLPKKLTQRVKIENLRFYFSGENMFTWTFGNLTKYLDPEMAGSGIDYSSPGTAATGSRVEDYPIGKTYSVGVNITL